MISGLILQRHAYNSSGGHSLHTNDPKMIHDSRGTFLHYSGTQRLYILPGMTIRHVIHNTSVGDYRKIDVHVKITAIKWGTFKDKYIASAERVSLDGEDSEDRLNRNPKNIRVHPSPAENVTSLHTVYHSSPCMYYLGGSVTYLGARSLQFQCTPSHVWLLLSMLVWQHALQVSGCRSIMS